MKSFWSFLAHKLVFTKFALLNIIKCLCFNYSFANVCNFLRVFFFAAETESHIHYGALPFVKRIHRFNQQIFFVFHLNAAVDNIGVAA